MSQRIDPRGCSPDAVTLTNSSYKIAWICTLPCERAAAEVMLDRVHRSPKSALGTNDEIYTLGSIGCEDGEHNVVIATLPSGRPGTLSAATAVAPMFSRFPNVRYGFMVGIGGGIPDIDHDIRLGDVVVGRPKGPHSAVRQYDLSKVTPEGIEEGEALQRPPRLLLNAVNVRAARYDMYGITILETLETMYKAQSNMASPSTGQGYFHPGQHLDRLFKAGYQHVENDTNCDGCLTTELVPRRVRNYLDPVVYYGFIASGNMVIRDGRTRDSLGKGCLCFETEAAGLMNEFPWLVIRGIADYCDSHKNDAWQRYAAATAAAYARELLQILPSRSVDAASSKKKIWTSSAHS